MLYIKIVIFCFLVLHSIEYSNADRIKDTMYEKINSYTACYRRMNSTHQIGCSSKRGGSIGVVHYCDNIQDLDFILKNGSAGPYIPILPAKYFRPDIIHTLVGSGKISGLILHGNNETLSHFSHEEKCPNNRFSVDGTCKGQGWNPFGTGLLYADIPFPIFFVENDGEIIKIKQCFQQFNNFSYETQRDRPLCSLELDAFMYATTNTPVCKRRSNIVTNLNPVKLCDPLGDSNVWASLFPLVDGAEHKPIKDSEYILVASRMDTTSMFEKTSGAENPITGMVALMAVAKLLKQMLPNRTAPLEKKNVLFVLFNGETYDLIGSQRLLYDMERGDFPIALPSDNDILPIIYPENITLFIELSQLAKGDATYIHYLNRSNQNNRVSDFIKKLLANNPSFLPTHVVPDSLPPSSLHTFVNSPVQGLVLTNHRSEYRNPFYNSIYDNASNIIYEYHNESDISKDSLQQYVADVTVMVAKGVYEELTGRSYSEEVAMNLTLVDELFHCYLEDANCKVHKAIQKSKFPKSLSFYVGVTVVDNFLSSLAALTLAWLTGDDIGPSGPNCTNSDKNHVYRYYNMSSSMDDLEDMRCIRATVNLTEAVSPAFIIPDYDWSSNKYSSWSESTWHDIKVRMFLKPSAAHENLTVALGSLVMIFAFFIVYVTKSRSDILFRTQTSAELPASC